MRRSSKCAITLTTLALSLSSCSVQVAEGAGKLCDATMHPCTHQLVCLHGECQDPNHLPDAGEVCSGAAVLATPNLVKNPSFETDLAGWVSFHGSTLQRISGGHDGAFSVQVTGPASTSDFGIEDSPYTVRSTTGSQTLYCFSAWLRSDAQRSPASWEVREYDSSGSQVGTSIKSAEVPLSTTWQQINLSYVTQGPAGASLYTQVLDSSPAGAGEIFDVDDVSIRKAP